MQFASTVGSGTGRPFRAMAYVPKVQLFKELEMKTKRVCPDRLQRNKPGGSQMNNLTGLVHAIAGKAREMWVSGFMAAEARPSCVSLPRPPSEPGMSYPRTHGGP